VPSGDGTAGVAARPLQNCLIGATETHLSDRRCRGEIVGSSKHSRRRVDLAVATIMTHSRAVLLARRPAARLYV
jgi:hypothetical protein